MAFVSPIPETEPPHDCPRCPRLVALRAALKVAHPDWWNAPVPAFGDRNAWLAIIGLAPGKQGANRTGRPFTGDYAGELLFEALGKFGHLAEHRFAGGEVLIDSYHCSRYNQNTGRLTRDMFEAVFERALALRPCAAIRNAPAGDQQ
jgi:uracil-DNA glycosylase